MRHTFGSRLKKLRLSRLMSQGALAATVGCTQAAISEYELGRVRGPGVAKLNALARLFSVSPLWLLTGKDEG